MRENKIKSDLLTGKTIFTGWLHIPSLWSAEIMGQAGWDSVAVDMQHGLMGMETAIKMMQVISSTPAIPLARCNWNDKGSIMKLLDGGAYGIICPMINSKTECEQFVGACKYPPAGYRSFGPTRGRVYGGSDYGEHANSEILTLAMIETKEAVAQIDEILSVEGLDGIFVGSGDLKLSLTGKAGHDQNHEEFDQAINLILDSCKAHDKIPGIWCANAGDAQKQQRKGFRFIAVSSDGFMLMNTAKTLTNKLKIEIK